MMRWMRMPRVVTLIFTAGAAASAASAQVVAGGTVLQISASDSVPVSGTRVVLHRIGREAQGPVDSARTDARGQFRFRFAADTGAVYLVSAQRGGIEYFSTPVHLNPARPDTSIRIVVADTSSTAPVELEARHLVVGAPGADGHREIVDIAVLRNRGHLTRVAPDTVRPSWSGPLPSGTMGLEVGEGEFSPSAVTRDGDRVRFFAPIPPGEKQLVTEYRLPAAARTSQVAFDQPVELVNVLLAEPTAAVIGAGLALADTQLIEGRTYRRWTGSAAQGTVVSLSFPPPPLSLRWVVPTLVAIVAATLGLAAGALARAAPIGARGDAAATADGLLTRVATLDAQYDGREAVIPADEWRRYQEERARLKAELSAALVAARR
jgi:hypothetical protein